MRKLSSLFSFEKILFLQRVICTLLVALMLAFSFGPLFIVPFDDDFSEFYDSIDSSEKTTAEQQGSSVSFDFPSATLAAVKLISLSSANSVELSDTYSFLMENQCDGNVSIRATAIAYLLVQAYENDVTVILYLIFLYVLTLAIPIVIGISLMYMFVKYSPFIRREDGRELYKGTMRHLRHIVYLMPMSVLLVAIAPKVRFGRSASVVFIICILALLVNAIAPHLKNYTKAQRKYIRMIQCVSLLGIVFFAVFCISLVRSHAMEKFVQLFNNDSLSGMLSIFIGGNLDTGKAISIIMGVLILLGLYTTYCSFAFNLFRMAFITTRMKRKDYTNGAAYIKKTLLPNLMTIAYFILLGTRFQIVVYKEDGIYFYLLLASLAFMTLTEIIIVVLGATLCMDLGDGGKDIVLEGTVYEVQLEKYKVESGFSLFKKSKKE